MSATDATDDSRVSHAIAELADFRAWAAGILKEFAGNSEVDAHMRATVRQLEETHRLWVLDAVAGAGKGH